MVVDQLNPRRSSRSRDGAKLVQYDQYIDTQIGRTRRMIKVVDVAAALILLATGAIAFLLVAALVEHWLVPGGFGTAGRFVLFAFFVGGAGYLLYRRLGPLLLRSINPVYAAQTIEQNSPSLKNSLLNLLLFRRHRAEVPAAVYETLEEEAAERLSRVPVDSAVDRTHLIRLGYVLLVVFTLAALYTMFSPKDPLIAAGRVLMPWAEIAPASRVTILDVEPGSTSVAQGEVVEVSAEVRGKTDDEAVLLRYTTDNEQAVDKAIAMGQTGSGRRFECRLPDNSQPGGNVGIAQDVRYWIEAGDARSPPYVITVVTAPTIIVQRVDYDYPAYTGYVDRHVDGLGDVRAIEGTRVTIHALANGPIDEAFVDFEADGRRDVSMEVDGTRARATFPLALRDDRTTPQHTSYVVRFTNSDGRRNRDPVQHTIDVLPDYRPEVELLAPQEELRDVRLDEPVTIEVEARDPDFALGEVRLQGEASGRTVVDEPLLDQEHTGRFAGQFRFTPSQHGLHVGETLEYWAMAGDNRAPDANVALSRRQKLRITSPERAPQPNADQPAQRQPNQPPGEDQQPENQRSEDQGTEGDASSAAGDEGEQQPAQDQREGNQGGEGQSGRDNGRDESQSQDRPGGLGGARGTGRESGDSQPTGEGGQPAEPTEGDAGRENRGNGASSRSGNGRQREPSEEQAPVSPDGDNDAEAFERIGRFLRERGELDDQDQKQSRPQDGESASEEQRSQDGESTAADGDQRKPDGDGRSAEDREAGSRDKTEPHEQPGPAQESDGEGPGAETTPGEPDQAAEQATDQRDKSDSPGGQQTTSKGPPGAGDQPTEDQGAPDAQPGMKPSDKWQQRPSDGPKSDDQEPPMTGQGKRESDSQGDQGGDQTGGGEEGGGQEAPREGTGSAGQNQSADEGTGESSERGAGRDSPDAGRNATAKDQTGESGCQETGQGSQRREGRGDQAGDQPPGREGQGDELVSREAQPSARPQDGEMGDQGSESSGTPSGGGGLPGQGLQEPQSVGGEAPDADEANLDYARKQTDLVLERLSELLKRKDVDQEMLDRLGWTEDELRQFIERWERLKAAARGDDPAADTARRELDDSLRSLGLRRGPLGQNKWKADELRDLREGYRGPVPLEYQERLRAYNEGISRARQEGE